MGPHVFNFLEISAMLREAGRCSRWTMPKGWPGRAARLVELPQDAQRMGEAGGR
jgi:3-deoxy-D-manno-octulosonic-acid transferase